MVQVSHLKLDTVIKLLTYPLTLGFSNSSIETAVFSNFAEKLRDIESWNLVQVCRSISTNIFGVFLLDIFLQVCLYMSRQAEHEQFPLAEIVASLDARLDTVTDTDQLTDLVECYHYLAQVRALTFC